MTTSAEMAPGEAPPEWEKANQALAAIQQSKKLPQEKKEQPPATEDDSQYQNGYERYGGPIGYPPNFNMMGGYGGCPYPPGPGFGWNSMGPPPSRFGMYGYGPPPRGPGGPPNAGLGFGSGGYGGPPGHGGPRPPLPPLPPGGFYAADDDDEDDSDFPPPGPPNRFPGSAPFQGPLGFAKKQAPGSGGIRFNIPKRNNFGAGNKRNAFQNYSNKRRAQQQMFENYKNQHQSRDNMNPDQLEKKGVESPNQSQPAGTDRVPPSPPPLPKSPTPVENEGSSLPAKKPESPLAPGGTGGPPAATGKAVQGDWPESLKSYVSRAFASVQQEHERDLVQDWLKKRLESAFLSGESNKIDWDKEPLPLESIQSTKQNFVKRNSRWGSITSSPGFSGLRGGKRGGFKGRGGGGFQGNRNRRSPPGYRRPRSRSPRSRSRSRSSSFSRSSRSYSSSRSRSRSRSPRHSKGRKGTNSRRWVDNRSPRRKFRDLGSESDSDGGSSPSGRRRSVVDSKRQTVKSAAAARGSGRGGKNNQKNAKKAKRNFSFKYNDPEKTQKMQKRAARFGDSLDNKKPRTQPLTLQINQFDEDSNDSEMDWSSAHIIGTCQDLEKGYLRLTTAPTPSQIRPLPVLKKSLDLVIKKWKLNHDYHHTCEQLKTIRQDLTVQNVRSEFTVRVYEIHGRIAMEMKDHEEFNQCQTNLKLLYAEGIPGNVCEFTAYRILYYIFTKNTMDMTSALSNLTAEQQIDEAIKHALAVRSAWSLNNYKKFYKLYLNSPKMSMHLIDWFLERERKNHFKLLLKVYRPMLPVKVVESSLGFTSRDECVSYLQENFKVVLTADQTKIDPKLKENSVAAL